jgi:hypothetical protein
MFSQEKEINVGIRHNYNDEQYKAARLQVLLKIKQRLLKRCEKLNVDPKPFLDLAGDRLYKVKVWNGNNFYAKTEIARLESLDDSVGSYILTTKGQIKERKFGEII